MGYGTTRRYDSSEQDGQPRMGFNRRWSVRRTSARSDRRIKIDALRRSRSFRLVSVARGEQLFFDPAGLPTATEGCKSNALMRCCKDLGIAGELWFVVASIVFLFFISRDSRFSRGFDSDRDPGFIRRFKAVHCVEAWTEHVSTKKR